MTEQTSSSFLQRPATRLGWWAVALTAVFVVMFIIDAIVFMTTSQEFSDGWWMQNILLFYGIFMLLCGLGGGIVGLIALIRKRERSWLVWLTILSGTFVLFIVLGEILLPH